MFINFNVSAVKAGSFVNDEKETIEYGYVYAVGEFKDSSNTDNFNTGIQSQKFKCRDKQVLASIRAALLKAKAPIDIQLDIDFTAKEGAISVPSVVGAKVLGS